MGADYYLAGLIGHSVRLAGIQTLVFFRPAFPLRLKPEPKHASGSIVGRPASGSDFPGLICSLFFNSHANFSVSCSIAR